MQLRLNFSRADIFTDFRQMMRPWSPTVAQAVSLPVWRGQGKACGFKALTQFIPSLNCPVYPFAVAFGFTGLAIP
jgi:hypothetical protein